MNRFILRDGRRHKCGALISLRRRAAPRHRDEVRREQREDDGKRQREKRNR